MSCCARRTVVGVRPTPNASVYRQSAWRFTRQTRPLHLWDLLWYRGAPFGGTVNDNRDEKAFSPVLVGAVDGELAARIDG